MKTIKDIEPETYQALTTDEKLFYERYLSPHSRETLWSSLSMFLLVAAIIFLLFSLAIFVIGEITVTVLSDEVMRGLVSEFLTYFIFSLFLLTISSICLSMRSKYDREIQRKVALWLEDIGKIDIERDACQRKRKKTEWLDTNERFWNNRGNQNGFDE